MEENRATGFGRIINLKTKRMKYESCLGQCWVKAERCPGRDSHIGTALSHNTNHTYRINAHQSYLEFQNEIFT